ncbi:MAG: ATP-binding protein [Rhodocyclaceae bacterium]|nr:ATP-binding protein [Rhodocyclaceae bacterium]
MALMNWNEHFVTGIEIIDSQHLGLVKIINDSAPFLALDYKRNPRHADKLLDQLTAYASFHFQTESDLIRQYQIDTRHTDHHFSAHKEFFDTVINMRALYQSGTTLTGGTLLGFLANWLIFHILGEDQALARQIKAIEAGNSPAAAYETAEGGRNDPTKDALTQTLVDLYALMTEQNRRLLEANIELQEHRNHLEELVNKRTQALEAALLTAETANQAKSSFVANLSHEIRTPMNAIVGLTWVLHEQSNDPAQKGKLHQVQNATQQLLSVINDLLDISSIESEQLHLEPLDFDIKRIIEHAIAAQATRAQHKGLRLLYKETTPIPSLLRGDPVRIGQIIGNFLSNAIKFTHDGEISIQFGLTPGTDNTALLSCAVRDEGIGIAPEALKRIFQPFTQADPSSRRRYGGTGLGLAISKRLVDMMGGRIGVESEVDRGSIFWFEIPLTVINAQHHAAIDNQLQPNATNSTNPIDAERLTEILNRLSGLLEEDDIQALTLWREMSSVLHPALGPLAEQLEGELNNYNFQAALTLTKEAKSIAW